MCYFNCFTCINSIIPCNWYCYYSNYSLGKIQAQKDKLSEFSKLVSCTAEISIQATRVRGQLYITHSLCGILSLTALGSSLLDSGGILAVSMVKS